MKKNEIRVGGLYTARISGRFVTVRVDAIREVGQRCISTWSGRPNTSRMVQVYDVTNLTTDRKTTFRSAAKFRGVAKKVSLALNDKIEEERVRDNSHLPAAIIPDPDDDDEEDDDEGNIPQPEMTKEEIKKLADYVFGPDQQPPLEPPGNRGPHDQGEAKELGLDSEPECDCGGVSDHEPYCSYWQWMVAQPAVMPVPGEPVVIDNPVGMTPEQVIDTAVEQAEAEQRSDPTQIMETVIGTGQKDRLTTNGATGAGNQEPAANVTSLAAKIAAQATPVATGLTQQQQEILATAKEIEAARDNGQRVLVIGAGAGTGKTFTLKQLEQVLQGNGQYTAFNSSLVAESKAKFKRAACNTTHSLAFRAVGCQFKHRLGGPRVKSWEVANRLGITDLSIELPEAIAPYDDGKPQVRVLKASYLAGQVTQAVRQFCQSNDREFKSKHFRRIEGIDVGDSWSNTNKVMDYLLPFARKMWADLTSKEGTLPFSHDVYVKLWELGTSDQDRPVIAADYILLDEAQDTAPVMLSILQQQTHALLILVGDDNQQIYEWRGAINAMSTFPQAPRKLLSQSFRFGQAVADVANAILGTLDEPTDLVMQGLPSIPTRVCEVKEPKCYLYRTNAGAIGKLMNAMDEGKKGHLIGGTQEVISFCRAALDLQAKKGTTHPELGCFTTWGEVQAYVKEDEGADLKLMVKLIDDFGSRRIIQALENMPPEDRADLVISTAHRSKGREWTSVRLGQDFKTANKLDDSERRLLYVAATRAQEELDLSQCPTFCGGIDKKGGLLEEGGNGGDWIPGIKINYTTPMPTQQQLDDYRANKLSNHSPKSAPDSPGWQIPAPSAPDAGDAKPGVQAGIPATSARLQNGRFSPPLDQNIWTKGKYNDWVVRGKAGQTGEVVVTRRNGTTSRETIKRVIWEDGTIALYEV